MESEANKERNPHPHDKKTSSSSSPSDDNQQDSSQGESQARPYECTFCKRGFSNAQALGGHMNIHRKDKAKLKQTMAPTTTSKSIDDERSINVVYAWPPWNIHHAEKECSSASKDRPIGESKQLPNLFVDHKQMSEDQNPIPSSSVVGIDQDLSSRSHDSSSDSELDLELRLGPDPPPSDSPTGTKKFF